MRKTRIVTEKVTYCEAQQHRNSDAADNRYRRNNAAGASNRNETASYRHSAARTQKRVVFELRIAAGPVRGPPLPFGLSRTFPPHLTPWGRGCFRTVVLPLGVVRLIVGERRNTAYL